MVIHKFKRRNLSTCVSEKTLLNLVSQIGYSINITGLWKGPTGTGMHWMAKVGTFSFLSSIVLTLIGIYMSRNDTQVLFESFSVFTFCVMGLLKLYSLCSSSKNWINLLTQVEALESQQLNMATNPIEYETDDEDDDNRFSIHIRRYTYKYQATAAMVSKFYYATLTIFICSPYAEYCISKLRGNDPGYPHILPEWAPLEHISIFAYIAGIIVFEVIACIYCVLIHTAFDLMSVGLMIFICGQYALLRDYSERIGGSGKEFELSEERDARAYFRIAKCHQIHVILINTITELEKIIKNVLGIYYLVVALTLCAVGVRMNSEELSVMQLVSFLQYASGLLTQLYLFCYFGDAVSNESSVGAGEGPFAVACWCVSPHVQRDLHLLAMGMSKPWRLRAGPFNSLNLPSFIQIVRTAYSYYAVLRK